MRKIFNDVEMNRQVVEQGYTHQQVLSDDEVSYLLGELQKTCPEESFDPQGLEPSHRMIYSNYLMNDQHLRECGDRLVREALTSHVESLLDSYRILSCGFFIKAPKGGALGVHAHWLVTENLRDTVINFWCPLVATNVENGTFHAVPGTHKLFPHVICFNHRPYFQEYGQLLHEKYSVPLCSRPGQAVIFDDTMIHWSPDNLSRRPRYAIHCTCIPKEARATYVFFDKSHPERFEVYAATDAFFVNNGLTQEIPRPTDLPFIGIIPNTNRPFSRDEFEDMMANGDAIRRDLATDIRQASMPAMIPMESLEQASLEEISKVVTPEEKPEEESLYIYCPNPFLADTLDVLKVRDDTDPQLLQTIPLRYPYPDYITLVGTRRQKLAPPTDAEIRPLLPNEPATPTDFASDLSGDVISVASGVQNREEKREEKAVTTGGGEGSHASEKATNERKSGLFGLLSRIRR